MRVAILGAGAMGSALATPLIDRGHEVRLWGTWLDDHIIEALRRGAVHPGTKAPVPAAAVTYMSEELAAAMAGAEIVLMAVTSEGLAPVFQRAVPHLRAGQTVVTVAKGFNPINGRMELLPTVLESMLPANLRDLPIVAVGGPSKAVEVGMRSPTAVVYASKNIDHARFCQSVIQTDVYFVQPSDDIIGVEICAALKNVYAIGLGICEGFREGRGVAHNNTKSALFQQAVDEMALISAKAGGRAQSAFGLAGCGDLEVTGEAGRNRILGELIGKGLTTEDSVAQMNAQGLTVEGYPAANLGWQYCQELGLTAEQVPLLNALYRILYDRAAAWETLRVALYQYFAAD